jgi:tryptophan synthase alpha subunit
MNVAILESSAGGSPEQAQMVAGCVDGIIVGSSIVHLMGNHQDWKPAVAELASAFKRALRERVR